MIARVLEWAFAGTSIEDAPAWKKAIIAVFVIVIPFIASINF